MVDDVVAQDIAKYNVYFTRKPNLVGQRYSYQNYTTDLAYKEKIYFQFIVSEEAKDWLIETNKTHYCIIKHDVLQTTLNDNGYDGTGFIQDEERTQLLDLSMLSLAQLTYHIDYTIEKVIQQDEVENV